MNIIITEDVMKNIFLIVCITLFVSCVEKNNVQVSVNDDINEANDHPFHKNYMIKDIDEIILIYEEPDTSSKVVFYPSTAQLVQVIETGKMYELNNINAPWVKVRTENNFEGWCFSGFLEEINESPENISMNRISPSKLSVTNIDGEAYIYDIDGKEGSFSFDYNMNKVYINFWSKLATFDSDYEFKNTYYPEEYQQMEISIYSEIDNFPSHYFNQNRRKNTINGITFVDSFTFSAYEVEDQQLRRTIFFSTNDYDFEITLLADDKDLIKNMIFEAPLYFKIRNFDEQNDITSSKDIEGNIIWDYLNKAAKKFGDNLISGTNPSKTATAWYKETEDFISGLYLY
jgi:hypothetical protein